MHNFWGEGLGQHVGDLWSICVWIKFIPYGDLKLFFIRGGLNTGLAFYSKCNEHRKKLVNANFKRNFAGQKNIFFPH